jgi:hypothetical protein
MTTMDRGTRFLLIALAASANVPAFAQTSGAQNQRDELPSELHLQRNKGDSVQPVFDGWQRYPDGTISMWFGYYNRNLKEEVSVPLGPQNRFNSIDDQGQPSYFYPKRRQYAFKVDLPKDWREDQKLIWTVTANGETCTATGWLQPEWEVDDGVRQMNAGGAGLAPPADPPNTAPKITGGSPDQTTVVGKPVRLSVSATDDGIPKQRGGRGGVRVRWILYRGPGPVTFIPSQTAPVYGKPIESTTEVTFGAPGAYWVQGIVSDGLLEAVHNVKVLVGK